jgi:transcriptional regulator with XRE-family HTH domain
MKTFIDRLKHAVELRERETGEKILKKELAAAAGVTSSAVSLWYDGSTSNVKADVIFRLARFLRVRVEWLKYERGPVKESDGSAPGAADEEPVDPFAQMRSHLSNDAKRLVDQIIEADHDKKISKETWKALSAIVHGLTDRMPNGTTISGADAILVRAIAEASELPGNKAPAKKTRRKETVKSTK